MRSVTWRVLGAAAVLSLIGAGVHADEVDDILKLKARNRDRVRRFSAEYRVETKQPASLKNPKTLTLRYKLKLEKLPDAARKHAHQPWRMEAEVIEPLAMHLKVEGEQAWFLDHHGAWHEMQLTPELREQFFGMSERFLGADPAEQRKHFAIKLLRHNNPIFGPRTRTVEFVPRGRSNLFARMEEDVNGDGLPLATRLFDDHGKQTVAVTVTKHRKVNSIPVVEAMEAVSQTTAGEVVSRTTCVNQQIGGVE